MQNLTGTDLAKNSMRAPAASQFEDEVYERQVRLCKAFANKTRLRILDLLSKRVQTVSSLRKELGVSTANMSQHLAILRAVGVVVSRRMGRQVYCSIAIPEVKEACQLIRGVLRAQIRSGRKLPI